MVGDARDRRKFQFHKRVTYGCVKSNLFRGTLNVKNEIIQVVSRIRQLKQLIVEFKFNQTSTLNLNSPTTQNNVSSAALFSPSNINRVELQQSGWGDAISLANISKGYVTNTYGTWQKSRNLIVYNQLGGISTIQTAQENRQKHSITVYHLVTCETY